MNQSPPSTNPRRRSRTASYRAAKVRQGERWAVASVATERALTALWLDVTGAWRRWMDDPTERWTSDIGERGDVGQ